MITITKVGSLVKIDGIEGHDNVYESISNFQGARMSADGTQLSLQIGEVNIGFKDLSNFTIGGTVPTNAATVKTALEAVFPSAAPATALPTETVATYAAMSTSISSDPTTKRDFFVSADETNGGVATEYRYNGSSKIRLEDSTINKLVWQHPRGTTELTGNATYAQQGLAFYESFSTAYTFNQIEVPAWGFSTTIVRVRIYKSSAVLTTPANGIMIEEINYPTGAFNRSSTSLAVIVLTNALSVAPGEFLTVFIYTVSGTLISINRWSILSGQTPERHNFLYTTATSNEFGSAWLLTSSPYYQATFNLKLNAVITSAYVNRLANVESKVNYAQRLVAPSNVYVAIGRELNIWNDAIMHSPDDESIINFTSTLASAATKERGLRYTPTIIETGTVTATIKDKLNNVLATKAFTVNAVSKTNGGGATKQLLFVGDSLMSQGNYPSEFSTLCTADGGVTPYFLGTQGTPPLRHEGRPGWTFSQFITSGSPFYDATNSRLDVKKYMTTNSNFGGSNTIDYAFIQLGINEILSATSTANVDTAIVNAKTLINAILDATLGFPSCKIILCIPPISGKTKDGFATNYAANKDKFLYDYYMRYLWEQLVANFETTVYNANVLLCATGLWVDRFYGYTLVNANVSARNTTQISEHNNGVHPNTSGHNQIVDAMYSRFRSLL